MCSHLVVNDGMKVDITQTYTVCSFPWYRITKHNIALATAVTEDGREVQGIGAHTFSTSKAEERAIENAKEMAVETDVSFTVTRIAVPSQRTVYSFLKQQGVVRSDHVSSLGGRPTVEVQVSDGERQADGKGKQNFLSALFTLGRKGEFSGAIDDAVESAAGSLDRTGTVSVDA